MTYRLISETLIEAVTAALDPDTAAQFQAGLFPTAALPLDAVGADLSSAEFHRAFVAPLEAPAQRAGLMLAVLVAEPEASGNRLRAANLRRLLVVPPAEGARRILGELLQDASARG